MLTAQFKNSQSTSRRLYDDRSLGTSFGTQRHLPSSGKMYVAGASPIPIDRRYFKNRTERLLFICESNGLHHGRFVMPQIPK
jgi:hypothetical protein